ncbi:MAG: hypothetical protein IKZ76_00430, partial [Lachnospiraceae bacterium]|nr:hypothetical protein [Lachnospiraceae bacterium]
METYTYEETIKTPEPKKTRKGKTALKVAALALGCSLLGGAVGAGGTAVTGLALYTFYKPSVTSEKDTAIEGDTTTIYEGVKENPALSVSYKDTSKEMSASEVYAQNVNSTVGITTSITTNYFGY